MAGVDAIVHLAGLVKARSLEEYREVNVRGTEQLLIAAQRESARDALFLLVSSQAARGPGREGRPVLDGDPARPSPGTDSPSAKPRSRRGPFLDGTWIVLRPGVIYGPGDRGLFLYFRMAAAGWIPRSRGRDPSPAHRRRSGRRSRSRGPLAAGSRRAWSGFFRTRSPSRSSASPEQIAGLPRRRARLISGPQRARARSRGRGVRGRDALTGRSQPVQRRQGQGDPGRRLGLRRRPTTSRLLGLPEPVPLERGPAGRLGLVSPRRVAPGRHFVKFAKIRPRYSISKVGGAMSKSRPGGQGGDGREPPRSSRSATGTRRPPASARPAYYSFFRVIESAQDPGGRHRAAGAWS